METKRRQPSVESVLGRPFASLLKPPALDTIQWGSLKFVYRGAQMMKDPFDLALYTLLIERLRPRTVIEIGTWEGGSAMWFADALAAQHIADARIITIDIEARPRPTDERVEYVIGDVHALDQVLGPETMTALPRPILAIDDASHRFEDCLAALEFFHRHLEAGDYLVVEDGILSQYSHPMFDGLEDGPNRAVVAFLTTHPEAYEIDTDLCDHFGYNVTFNPNGWLRRV